MLLISTRTPVTEIPERAMLDLEEIGGGGLLGAYAVALDISPDGRTLLADYEGDYLSFRVTPDTTIPVITYAQPS